MISNRVHTTSPRLDRAEFEGDFIIAPAGKRWSIYHDGSEYSQTSGGTVKLGKVIRGWDDKPIKFRTRAEAVRYVRENLKDSGTLRQQEMEASARLRERIAQRREAQS